MSYLKFCHCIYRWQRHSDESQLVPDLCPGFCSSPVQAIWSRILVFLCKQLCQFRHNQRACHHSARAEVMAWGICISLSLLSFNINAKQFAVPYRSVWPQLVNTCSLCHSLLEGSWLRCAYHPPVTFLSYCIGMAQGKVLSSFVWEEQGEPRHPLSATSILPTASASSF